MILNLVGGGRNTSDSTIDSADVMKGEIAYGSEGRVVGTAPFSRNSEGNYFLENAVVIHSDGCEPKVLLREEVAEPWAQSQLPSITQDRWLYLIYEGNKFIASGNGYAVSEDGISWELKEANYSGSYGYPVYGEGKFLFSSSSSGEVLITTDFETWRRSSLPIKSSWQGIAYGNGLFVTVNKNYAAVSEDGVSWELVELPSEVQRNRGVVYGNGVFVTVVDSELGYYQGNYGEVYEGDFYASAIHILVSQDGKNWTAVRHLVKSSSFSGIEFCNDRFFLYGHKDSVWSSSDGLVWEEHPLPEKNFWYDIGYGNGKYRIVGLSCGAYSSDGVTWTKDDYFVAGSGSWGDIVYGAGRFVVLKSQTTELMFKVDYSILTLKETEE